VRPKLAAAAIIFVLLAAAAQHNAAPDEPAGASVNRTSVSMPDSKAVDANQAETPHDELKPLQLQWESYSNAGEVRLLKTGLAQAERIVKETALYAVRGSRETKVIVYAKKNDTDALHAALVRDDAVYDLGPVAGYHYDKADDVTVSNIMLFGKQVIKIQGAVGAAASLARYIDLEDGAPKPLMLIDEGHASELDVDHDGLPEVVASSGTKPSTSVFRWKDGRIERCRLNETLQAEAVSITDEGAVFASFGQNQSAVRLYWLKQSGLQPFASYSGEEYGSDRFVAIQYTADDAKRIRGQADKVRVFDPYVPRKGIATDYVMEAEIEQDGVMKMTFPHFSVRQSRTDLRPQEQGKPVSGDKLIFPGFAAEWIGPPENGGTWYIQRGSTYISVSTAKGYDKDQLLFVAASLIPLEELKLSDGTAAVATPPPQITREYLFALQAANKFAAAWASRDPNNGLEWVTDEWKAGKEPPYLDAYFRGTSNPHHLTFELSGKRRVDDRTYLFNLRLYDYYRAQPDSVLGFPADYGRGQIIEVIKQGDNEWGEGIWRVQPGS